MLPSEELALLRKQLMLSHLLLEQIADQFEIDVDETTIQINVADKETGELTESLYQITLEECLHNNEKALGL